MKFGFILLAFILFPFFAHLQTLHYDMNAKHENIGQLTITETSKDDSCIVDVNSDVKINMGLTLHIKYVLHSVFKNTKLQEANVEIFVNNKKHSDSEVDLKGKQYEIFVDNKKSVHSDPIKFSGSMLYLHEPVNASYVFSEINGINKKVTRVGDNSYELENPGNGQISRYTYKDGILQKVSIHHDLYTFELVLKPISDTLR